MVRHNKGRQKIEMKKMADESNLQVTFSKRRNGVFKKACELSTLCAAEIALIVFSPGKKAFSFGNPTVKSVIDRYLTGNHPPAFGRSRLIEAHRNDSIRNINAELTQVLDELEGEKQRSEELKKMKKARQEGGDERWWEKPIQEQSVTQLKELKLALEDLKKIVKKQIEILMYQNSQQYFNTNNCFDAAELASAGVGGPFLDPRTIPAGANVVLAGPSTSNIAYPYNMNTTTFDPYNMPPLPPYDHQGYRHEFY